jgi:hypothetical protein
MEIVFAGGRRRERGLRGNKGAADMKKTKKITFLQIYIFSFKVK